MKHKPFEVIATISCLRKTQNNIANLLVNRLRPKTTLFRNHTQTEVDVKVKFLLTKYQVVGAVRVEQKTIIT